MNNLKVIKMEIVGYVPDEHCHHCGRKLVHGIRLSNGLIVGAACFAKKITLPRMYQGRKSKLSSNTVIWMAKIAAKYDPIARQQFGLYRDALVFEINPNVNLLKKAPL